MRKKLVATALILSALAGLIVGYAIQQYTLIIPTQGKIKGIGVSITWTSNQSKCNTIEWGTIENNTATLLPETITLTNTNNTACTFTLATVNPSPNLLSLNLTWNITQTTVLQPNMSVIAKLTLTATSKYAGEFNFDIIIKAEAT